MTPDSILDPAIEAAEDAIDRAKDAISEAPKRARGQIDDLQSRFGPAAKRVSDTAASAWKSAREQALRNPGRAVCLGALVGFGLGFLARRND